MYIKLLNGDRVFLKEEDELKRDDIGYRIVNKDNIVKYEIPYTAIAFIQFDF